MAHVYAVADDRPALTLAELESFDPYAPPGGRYRRFHCPLCDVRRPYRQLSLEVETGGWLCFRCGNKGRLREHWQPQTSAPRSRKQAALARLRAVMRAAPASEPTAATDPAPVLATSIALADTPGADYVESRGIPLAVAEAAGVLYCADFYGRGAVLFPMVNRAGQVVAVNGRYLDSGTPKTRSIGPKSTGVYRGTPDALAAAPIIVCEGPFDSLSFTAAGFAAIALVGTTWPAWLRIACGLRPVALAFDADEAGDNAAEKLDAELVSFGAKLQRWRPPLKDWNETLTACGLEGFREAMARCIVHARGN